MEFIPSILLTGIGATFVTDLWGWARRPLLGVPAPDYRMVGRWIAHMPRGRLRHAAIVRADAIAGEQIVGWAAHYLIGMAFAFLLFLCAGREWFAQPRLVPALLLGLATSLAPFLLMQPAMGAGIAAARTPRPGAARIQTLLLHAAFGVGLYAAAASLRHVLPVYPA
jgi:hypothetical protein